MDLSPDSEFFKIRVDGPLSVANVLIHFASEMALSPEVLAKDLIKITVAVVSHAKRLGFASLAN